MHICNLFRFRAQTLDGYRLLLYSSVAASLLFAIARLITAFGALTAPGIRIAAGFAWFAPIPYLGTAAVTPVLGVVFALLFNLLFNDEQARAREIMAHGNSLLQLFHQADLEQRMLSITLDNRKWYVGRLAESPTLEPSERYFKILPVLSGYREKDTLQFVRTVSYEDVLKNPNVLPSEFLMTLPVADVKIANLFDPDIYDEHFAPRSRVILVGHA